MLGGVCVMLTYLPCVLWGCRWSSQRPGFMRRPSISCCTRPRTAEDLTTRSWRPRAGRPAAPTTWMRMRSASASASNVCGASTSSGRTTGHTSTSERASERASRLPPPSSPALHFDSCGLRAPSTFPGDSRYFCNKPDDYFDIF